MLHEDRSVFILIYSYSLEAMSSNDNSQNDAFMSHSWNSNLSGDEDALRPPNRATESRVLSRLYKNGSKPDNDFRNPPPNGSQSQAPTSSSSHSSQQPLTLPVVPSVLSATAKVFVPRSEQVYLPDSYAGEGVNPDDLRGLSVSAPEFIPQQSEDYYDDTSYPNAPYEGYDMDAGFILDDFNSMNLYDQFGGPMYSYEELSSTTGRAILDRFNQALRALNMDPGNMEDYLHPICQMIQKSNDTQEIVNEIVESLFNQSIQEQNFRYTGARICQFLNSNLKQNPYFAGFHKIFIGRCQKEYNRRMELKNGSPADQERLRGLAMFMAEIFLNVETETTDGTVQRLQFLPSILVDFVQTLLSKPTDLDVKCACQLFKLSGGLIEDVVKHSPEQCLKFEAIFTQLQSLSSSPELKENTKFLIDSVMKLKNSDWNRRTSPPPSKTSSASSFSQGTGQFKSLESAFSGISHPPSQPNVAPNSGGNAEAGTYVLNDEEEAAYLAWQAEEEGLTEDQGPLAFQDTGYESYYLDEGGMGDEMEAAYEEFLQKQTIMQGYQPRRAGPAEQQQMVPPIHQIINQPPPSIPLHPAYNGFPPPQHVPPPNLQQNQLPQQRPDQQQQQQPHQQYQNQYQSNDRYHYHR